MPPLLARGIPALLFLGAVVVASLAAYGLIEYVRKSSGRGKWVVLTFLMGVAILIVYSLVNRTT